jgi:hypothetical protein
MSAYAEWLHNKDVPDVTELQETVLGLLESAGIPTEVNDQIVRLIEQGERATNTPPATQAEIVAILDDCHSAA